MKLLFSALAITLFSLTVAAQKQINDPNVEVRKVNASFHGISVSGGIDLYISPGSETVAVSASEAEHRDRIKTVVENGILKIYYDNEGLRGLFRNMNQKLRAYVSYKTLTALSASGGCDIIADDVIRSSSLKLSLSGGCDFSGKVDVGELVVSQSGGTDVKITGKAARATVHTSGGSDFKGDDFIADIANLSASGGSDIHITAAKEISAKASGASDISYKGSPEVKVSSTSGASSIKKRSR